MPAQAGLGGLSDHRHCRTHVKVELQGGSFAGGHTRLSHLQMDAMHMAWRHAFLKSQQGGLKMAQRRQHRLAIGKCGEGVVSGLLG